MKKFIWLILGISALSLGLGMKYFPLTSLTHEDDFANNFLSLLEDTIPRLTWPTNSPSPKENNAAQVPILIYHSVRPAYSKQT